jgi:hypothetical protein
MYHALTTLLKLVDDDQKDCDGISGNSEKVSFDAPEPSSNIVGRELRLFGDLAALFFEDIFISAFFSIKLSELQCY